MSRRVGWGLADQALSSLTNFAVGIAVARTVPIEQFGAFALVFATYSVVLGVSRALATDPLVVRHSRSTEAPDVPAERRATGSSLGIGLAAGAALLALSVVVPGEHRELVVALAVVIPGLMLQDAWRVLFFVRGRGRSACLNDLVWALALPVTFLVAMRHPSAASMTLAWGAAGCIAAGFGLLQTRLLPQVRQTVSWLRSNWDLSSRYLAESIVLTGTQQAYFFVIGAISGLGAVGEIRLALVVLGPVNIVIQGVGMAALPEVVRAAHRSRRSLLTSALAVSALVSLSALLWGLAVLTLPHNWLDWLVGTSWASASAVVLPLMLMQVLNGLNTGAYMGLRAMQQVNRGLALRIVSSADFLLGATIGAAVGGATGAAWGLVVAGAMNSVLWWLGYATGQNRWWHRVPAEGDASA